MVDTEMGSNSREQKSVVHQRGSVVDYWTKAMVQNMREETILCRKMAKIEREHTQVILQMTYDHRRLTDRLNLVNWFHKKKSEDRFNHDDDEPSSNSSFKSEDSRNFKAELREYKEWKEQHEQKRGRIPVKAIMEPELRERMKMEWNSLRRPPQTVLPPLVKPSFMYRQWKKKNKKKLKLSPKAMFEHRKMIALAEEADNKKRKKSRDGKQKSIPATKTDSKSVRIDTNISQKGENSEPPAPSLTPKTRILKPMPPGEARPASRDKPKSRESTPGHNTPNELDTKSKNNKSIKVWRPMSSTAASTSIEPLDLATNRNLSRSLTTLQ